jgi:hypothetical protein
MRTVAPSPWQSCGVTDQDAPRQWLTIPDLVDILGLGVGRVRRLIEDRQLAAMRIDGVLKVPADFIRDGEPLRELRGTLILLADDGFSDDEAIAWLLEPDDTLGIAPIDALRAGRKAEVRRVAQALA